MTSASPAEKTESSRGEVLPTSSLQVLGVPPITELAPHLVSACTIPLSSSRTLLPPPCLSCSIKLHFQPISPSSLGSLMRTPDTRRSWSPTSPGLPPSAQFPCPAFTIPNTLKAGSATAALGVPEHRLMRSFISPWTTSCGVSFPGTPGPSKKSLPPH